MPDIIFAGMERELGHYLHRRNHPVTITGTPASPQEKNHMTRLADAKNALDHAQAQLASLTGNALAEAIVEAGIGQDFGQKDVNLALALINAIVHFGPGAAMQQAIQQQDARDLQPQQPV